MISRKFLTICASIALFGCGDGIERPSEVQAFIVIGAGNGVPLSGREIIFFDDNLLTKLISLENEYVWRKDQIAASVLDGDPAAAAKVKEFEDEEHAVQPRLEALEKDYEVRKGEVAANLDRAQEIEENEINPQLERVKAKIARGEQATKEHMALDNRTRRDIGWGMFNYGQAMIAWRKKYSEFGPWEGAPSYLHGNYEDFLSLRNQMDALKKQRDDLEQRRTKLKADASAYFVERLNSLHRQDAEKLEDERKTAQSKKNAITQRLINAENSALRDEIGARIKSLFSGEAILKDRTGLDGKAKIPRGAKYAFLTASRSNGETYQWFVELTGKETFILSNHNISSRWYELDNWIFSSELFEKAKSKEK